MMILTACREMARMPMRGELEGDNGGSSACIAYPAGRKASYQEQAQAGGFHQIQHSPGGQALFCSGHTARPAEAHEGARLHQRPDPCTRCCCHSLCGPVCTVKAIRAATRLGTMKVSRALAAVAAETGVAEMEVP
jgi:ferredoxin